MTKGEEELLRVAGICAKIKAITSEIERTRESALSISSPAMGVKVSGSGSVYDLSSILIRLEKSLARLLEELSICVEERDRITAQVLSITPEILASILYWRYIKSYSLKAVAAKVSCSESTVRHQVRTAIKLYDKKYFGQ